MATAATAKYVIRLEDKTKRAFKAIGRSMKSVTKSIFSLKTGLVSVAGIAGLGFLVKRSMDATDEMAKMSRAIGVSVENLSALRHAASLGGLASVQLDKAVQKLAINLADVAGGTGEALDEFKQFNIAAVNADGSMRDVMSVLADVADVTQSLGDTTERTNLMYKLFGARGAKMVNVLKDGSGAMREAMKEAELLGLVMSQDTVEGVEAANDAFTRLKAFATSTFAQTVAALAPSIEALTESVIEFITLKVKSTDGGIAAIAQSMANMFIMAAVRILQSLENITNGVIDSFKKIRVAIGMGTAVEELQEELADLQKVKDDFEIGGYGSNDNSLFEMKNRLIAFGLDIKEVVGNIFTDGDMTSKITSDLDAQMDLTRLKIEALGETTVADTTRLSFQSLIDTLMQGHKVISMMETGVIEMAETSVKAGEAVTEALKPHWSVSAMAAVEAYKAATMDTVKATTMATNSMIKGTEDQIMNMINGVKTSWKAMFKGIMSDLLRIQVRKAVVGAIGGIGSLLGFEGGGYTGMGARAGGVDGRGGFPAILHPNETVVDHTKGGGMGGGVTTAEINFNVQAIDASSFNTYLVNNRDTIESIINNSLLSNGTVRRTIQMTA